MGEISESKGGPGDDGAAKDPAHDVSSARLKRIAIALVAAPMLTWVLSGLLAEFAGGASIWWARGVSASVVLAAIYSSRPRASKGSTKSQQRSRQRAEERNRAIDWRRAHAVETGAHSSFENQVSRLLDGVAWEGIEGTRAGVAQSLPQDLYELLTASNSHEARRIASRVESSCLVGHTVLTDACEPVVDTLVKALGFARPEPLDAIVDLLFLMTGPPTYPPDCARQRAANAALLRGFATLEWLARSGPDASRADVFDLMTFCATQDESLLSRVRTVCYELVDSLQDPKERTQVTMAWNAVSPL